MATAVCAAVLPFIEIPLYHDPSSIRWGGSTSPSDNLQSGSITNLRDGVYIASDNL